ncbi:MAG: GAF domain-containing protein [Chloroflexi bacterium]|nr:MAG: GAF domain-containing protein [Chloroflexota bacterium]
MGIQFATSQTASIIVLLVTLIMAALVLRRRYRSRQALLRRVSELEALSAAGRAIVSAELDLMQLCRLIADEAGKVIDNRTFQIGLFEDSLYEILFWRIEGEERETPQTFDLRQNSGIVGWVRQSRQPLLVHDFEREMNTLPARPRYVSDTPPRSAIFIPLLSGEDVIGIMAAQSRQPRHFSEEDLRRLTILANQAAAAIAHTRTFEQAQKRAAQLQLVGQIGRQVNGQQDLEGIFTQAVWLTRETFGFHPVNIFAVDEITGEVVIRASTRPDLMEHQLRLQPGQGLIGSAVSQRETIVCNNTTKDPRFVEQVEAQGVALKLPAQAEIVIPLMVDEEVLGVLDVQSPKLGVFGATEKLVLEALGAEIAIAIDKARQLARQREQAWITTAQLQVAEAVGHTDDLDIIATTLVRLTPMLVGVSFCALLVWDEETAVYRSAALYGADQELAEAFHQSHLAIGDWHPLDAVHVSHLPLTTTQPPPWTVNLQTAGEDLLPQWRLWPIISKDEILGIIVTEPLEETAVSANSQTLERRLELLQNILQQAGYAIERARLRLAQQEEAWVNTVLLQTAEAVNSLIDLNEILDTLIRLVPMLVGVESALILIWDAEKQHFRAGSGYGLSAMGQGLIESLTISQDEFLKITPQSGDFLTPNAAYYAIELTPWLQKVMGTAVVHAFPLNARGQLVGVMLVGSNSENGRTFSNRRLHILNGIAHQAATAVVNHQLYQEAAERDRLEQELHVAQEIQASLIPPGSPHIPHLEIASYWQAARQVGGDFYDFLPLPDGKWGIVVADVADKGVPAALFMALSRTILRAVAFSRQNPAEVLTRANQIIDQDAQSDLFVTLVYAIWDPHTATLTYANAGHNPPLLLRQNGHVELLKGTGMALGVLPDVKITQKTLCLHPNDTLILYTDGVTEAVNANYDEFGLFRLQNTVQSVQKQPATEIIQAIMTAVRQHAADTPQADDITLVVIKHRPTESAPNPHNQ